MTTIVLGAILGICFGLTGSGGSTFGVPLLVYGAGLPPHHAVCISMITVGIMAALRSVHNLRRREVEFRTASVLAAAGLAGAPAGAWAGRLLPGNWLLFLFAIIAVVVALRMIMQGADVAATGSAAEPVLTSPGRTRYAGLGSASILTLCATGFTTGFLAGLLGIGGGFVVVPALVLFCGLEIHRAIATSMFCIAIISVAAMTGHWFAGQRPQLQIVGLFSFGGMLGLVPGTLLGARLPARALQRTFAVTLLLLALFIAVRSLPW